MSQRNDIRAFGYKAIHVIMGPTFKLPWIQPRARNPEGILLFGSLKQNFKIGCWENSEHTHMFWVLPHPSGALPPRNKPRIPRLKPLNNKSSNDEWPSFGYGVKNFKEQTSEISHGIINHKRTPTPRHPLHKIATEIEKYN